MSDQGAASQASAGPLAEQGQEGETLGLYLSLYLGLGAQWGHKVPPVQGSGSATGSLVQSGGPTALPSSPSYGSKRAPALQSPQNIVPQGHTS